MPTLAQAFASAARLRTDRSGFERSQRTSRSAWRARRRAISPDGQRCTRAATTSRCARCRIAIREARADAVHDASLQIPAGASGRIRGPDGSGKTTLADLIIGLLPPTQGCIEIDGQPLAAADLRRWQARIAWVPQHPVLRNASLAENIAFGIAPTQIDAARVARAVDIAQLGELVASWPEGTARVVGERGARLSGGQRQLVGIARALYRDASLLLLDEATSALDDATEAAVMEALAAALRGRSCILITHRASVLRFCDRVIEFRAGRVRPRAADTPRRSLA